MEIVKEDLHIYRVCDFDENPYYMTTEVPMIRHNLPGSFLPVQIRETDSRKTVYYEITGRCSLMTWAESRRIGYEECQCILEGIRLLLRDVEEYLLSLNQVSLKKEEIYVSGEGRLLWMYTPFGRDNIHKEMEDLLLWILTVVDYHDRKALDLVYGTIHRLRKEDPGLSGLGEWICSGGSRQDTKTDAERLPEFPVFEETDLHEQSSRKENSDGPGSRDKKKKHIRSKTFILFAMCIDLAAFFYLCYCIYIRGATI
ncbi:MAG: hypothetical protein IKX76_03100, partial [Eubacterium sp.]|nr:hypothetical protein [Eubacterium sp.]